VLEVTAETTAPKQSFEQLLATVPADISIEEQEARKAATADIRAQIEQVGAAHADKQERAPGTVPTWNEASSCHPPVSAMMLLLPCGLVTG
jgi:hypothetical protein